MPTWMLVGSRWTASRLVDFQVPLDANLLFSFRMPFMDKG